MIKSLLITIRVAIVAIVAIVGTGVLILFNGVTVGQIESFKILKIENAESPSIGALYKLIGTDKFGKQETVYSSSLGKSLRGQIVSEVGLCYTLIGTTDSREVPSKFRISSSYLVTCQQDKKVAE